MLLTDAQLQEIRQIIADHHNAFVVNTIDPQAVTGEVLERLKQKGLINTQVNSIEDAYLYGQVLAAMDDPKTASMSLDEFRKHLRTNPVPLSPAERQALVMNRQQAAQYVRGLGNRIETQTGRLIIDADADLRRQMRDTITTKTAQAIATRQTVKKLKSDLGWATKDWTRDLDRIATTEKHDAMERGVADGIAKQHSGAARVAKIVHPDCCDRCRDLYVGADGAPRIFRLNQLEANGSNVGRKADGWLPVIGPTHPNCLEGSTRILTQRGLVPLMAVVPGDLVWTHKQRWQPVTHCWRTTFDGNLVRLVNDQGRALLATPNHPILVGMDNGGTWQTADVFQRGTHTFYYHGVRNYGAGLQSNTEDFPSQGLEMDSFTRVLFGFTGSGVPITAIDLNGELYLREGYIDDEPIHHETGDREHPRTPQERVDAAFVGTFKLTCLRDGTSALIGRCVFLSASNGMRRFSAPLAFCRIKSELLDTCSLFSAANRQAHFAQAQNNAGSGNLEMPCQSQNTHTGVVKAPKFPGIDKRTVPHDAVIGSLQTQGVDAHLQRDSNLLGGPALANHLLNPRHIDPVEFGHTSDRDAQCAEAMRDRAGRCAEPSRYFAYRTMLVAVKTLDDGSIDVGSFGCPLDNHGQTDTLAATTVTSVETVPHKGFVYNLTVAGDESYTANGWITHNCACNLVHVPAGWGFNSDGELDPDGTLGMDFDPGQLQASLRHARTLRKSGGSTVAFQGLPITLEHPAGSQRPWTDRDGNSGSTTMVHAYGYLQGTHGADGEEIDCYVGPVPLARQAFLIEQNDGRGLYDETKVMLGFASQQDALDAYAAHRNDGVARVGDVSSMSMQTFKRWLAGHKVAVGAQPTPAVAPGVSLVLTKAGSPPLQKASSPQAVQTINAGQLGVTQYADHNPRTGGYDGANFVFFAPPRKKPVSQQEWVGDISPERALLNASGLKPGADALRRDKRIYEVPDPPARRPKPIVLPDVDVYGSREDWADLAEANTQQMEITQRQRYASRVYGDPNAHGPLPDQGKPDAVLRKPKRQKTPMRAKRAKKPVRAKRTKQPVVIPFSESMTKSMSHRYISRQWNGTHWRYTYPADAQPHLGQTPLTAEENEALSKYAGVHYMKVNKHLRNGEPLPDYCQGVIEGLRSALNRCTLSEDTILWRGVGVPSDAKVLKTLQVGKTITPKEFSSTSRDKNQALHFAVGQQRILFHITCSQGDPAIDVNSHLPQHKQSAEKEVILPDKSRFVITNVEKEGDVLHVHMATMLVKEHTKRTKERKTP